MIKITLEIRFDAPRDFQESILYAIRNTQGREYFKFSEILRYGIDFDNMKVRPYEFNVERPNSYGFDNHGFGPRGYDMEPTYEIKAEAIAGIYPIPSFPAPPVSRPDIFGPLPVGDDYWAGDYIVYHKGKGWVRYSEFIDELTPKFETMIEFVQVSETEIDLKDFKDGFDVVEVEKDTIEIDL